MWGIFHRVKKHKELEHLLERIDSNMANNYKDAAQEYMKEYVQKFAQLKEAGQLNEEQISYYQNCLEDYQSKLKGYTHKDQKPYWT